MVEVRAKPIVAPGGVVMHFLSHGSQTLWRDRSQKSNPARLNSSSGYRVFSTRAWSNEIAESPGRRAALPQGGVRPCRPPAEVTRLTVSGARFEDEAPPSALPGHPGELGKWDGGQDAGAPHRCLLELRKTATKSP